MARNSRREVTLYFLSDEEAGVVVVAVEAGLELLSVDAVVLAPESLEESLDAESLDEDDAP